VSFPSSEILGEPALRLIESRLDFLKGNKFGFEIIIKFHDRSYITAAVTVVRSRPHRNKVLLREVELVSLLDELMGPTDEVEVVDVVELVGNKVSKKPPSTPRGNAPRLTVIGVRPHQVAELALVGDLLPSINSPDLVACSNFGGQSPVDTEDLSRDDSSQG